MKNLKIAILAAGLIASSGTAFGATYQVGDVFASIGGGLVKEFHADGTFVQTLNTGVGGFTTGSTFDSTGNFYVTDFSANRVSKFDGNGALVDASFITAGLSTPESILFDKAGNILVGSLGSGLNKYSSTGALLGNITSARVDWFDLSADQSTLLYDQEGGQIHTVSYATPGVTGANFTNAGGDYALRILSDGGALVANSEQIDRYNSAGIITQSYDIAGVDGWFALNLDPDGKSFWSGSFSDGIMRRFDIATGTLISSFNTGCGGSCLFGVSVYGEITAGGGGVDGGGTSVPEPGTTALLGIGLLGIGFLSRRRAS